MDKRLPDLTADKQLQVLDLLKGAFAIYTTRDIIIQNANDAMLAFWGQDKSIIGLPLHEGVPALKGQPFVGMLQKVLDTGIDDIGQAIPATLLINGQLQTSYFDYEYRAIRNADGVVYCILHTAEDVTERELARQELLKARELENAQKTALIESEERFRTMAESSDILIAVADESSNAVYFSKAWVELTGRSMEELLKFGWVDLVHPDDRDRYVNIYLSAFAKRETFTGEFRVLNQKGEYRRLLAKGPPRFRPDGAFAGYISSCIDITDSKANEIQLQQMINILPAHIVVIRGPELIAESINNSNLAYWSKTREQVIGKPLLEILPELVDQPFPDQLRHVMATGEVIDVKESPVIFVDADGIQRETFVDYTYQPLRDITGKATGVLVMSSEITDRVASRKLLEQYAAELQAVNEELFASNEELTATNEELRQTQELLNKSIADLSESEQRFRNLIHDATIGIILVNGPEMRVGIVNEAYGRIIEHTTAELDGQLLFDIIPEGIAYYKPIIEKVRTSGEPLYLYDSPYIYFKNGQQLTGYLNIAYQPYRENGEHISGVMVICQDVTEQVVARFKLKEADEMTAMAIEAARLGAWHIEPATKALKYNDRLAKIFGYEGKTEMTYEQAIAQVTEEYRPKILAAIEKAIEGGGDYDITYQKRRFNDGELIWLRSFGKINRDGDGNHTLFSGFVMDVTEQKKDEQRKNDFIGMVSHELKTPLTSLNAIVQLANQKLKKSDDPFLGGAMEKANNQVKRMTSMINGFLNISRLESGKILIEKQEFDISKLVQEIIEDNAVILSSEQIRYTGCGAVPVSADRDKIGSVISNLLSNAVKYSPKDSQVDVSCDIKDQKVTISVHDHGIGIRPEDIGKVFERYYRVNNNFTQHISGFGIGLYLSAEIIQRHNGRIWVESEIGKGSTFYFSLPLTTQQ